MIMRRGGAAPSSIALTLSSLLISTAMQPSIKAAAFVAPIARLSCLPRTHDVHGAHPGSLPARQPRLDTLPRHSALVSRRSPPLRQFTTMSMTMKDFDENDGNTTDIYESVGAAGNLRFPGQGFKPPVADPAPKVDRANFDVKPEDKGAKAKSFDEKQKRANFEDLVEFPCKFQIKIVGANQGEFVEDVLDSIGNVVKVKREELPHSVRDKGKWRSITVRVPVESADQLYDVYAAIDADPRVQFKF